jgi:hypothetical protein
MMQMVMAGHNWVVAGHNWVVAKHKKWWPWTGRILR